MSQILLKAFSKLPPSDGSPPDLTEIDKGLLELGNFTLDAWALPRKLDAAFKLSAMGYLTVIERFIESEQVVYLDCVVTPKGRAALLAAS